MVRYLERVLPYLLLVPAVLPLVYFDGLLFPYLTPKTAAFRGAAVLAFAVFVVLVLARRQFFFERLRNYATWIPAMLLFVAYLASLLGIDFYHSFWSVYDRGDGLLTLTSLVIFFYLTLLTAEWDFISRALKIISFVASLVAVFAVFQWLQNISGLNIPLIPDPHGRIGSTLGNAAFLASYLGLTFFLTLSVAPEVRGRWRQAAYAGAVIQLIAVIAASTRGTFLALIAAGSIALVYLAWKGETRYRTYARTGLVALCIAAGLFFAFRSELAQSSIEPVRRLASISTTDATVGSRLFIWQNVGMEALKTPLLGVGAEHIEYLFNRVYDPTAIQEEWFDRMHNAFLDYFVQYGVFGFTLYLALIAAFALFAVRRAGDEKGGMFNGRLLVLLAIVYALQNLFVFDTAVSLWLFLVLFAFLLVAADRSSRTTLVVPQLPVAVSVGAGMLIALLVIPVSLTPLYANMLLADGYLYHILDARRTTVSMEKGYALGTYADLEYGYQLYEMYSERQATMLSGEARLIAYRLAEKILSQNFENYPYDPRTATYYAHVLDLAPPEIQVDEARLRQVIARSIELSPKRMQPWYLLANISISKGDALPQGSAEKVRHYREGIAVLEEYTALVPKLAEPRFVLATMYLLINDRASAKKWADEALPLYKSDPAVARRASRYYVMVEDWENARRFLADVVASEPENYKTKYDLAKAEFLAGNVERAKQIVEELKKEAPGLVETDAAFMAAIGS